MIDAPMEQSLRVSLRETRLIVERLVMLLGVPKGSWGAVREVLVASGTVALAAMGARRIDVTWYGKAGTFGLMVAFPSFLASHSGWSTADFFEGLAWMRAGDFAKARVRWRRALALTPADAPYRDAIAQRVMLLDQAMTMMGQ